MSKEVQRIIEQPDDLMPAMQWAWDMAGRGLAGGPVVMRLGRQSKTRIQEEKYHAMINDIHRQCFRGYSAKGVKAVLVNQFAREMEEAGTPLAKPGEKVWDWHSQEPVYVRPSTTDFRKSEAAQFIEFLFSVGAEYQVVWSEKALKVYAEYKEAA